MAKISSQLITITISKLTRDDDSSELLTDTQLLALLETLPGVVEEILADSKLVVEATIDPP
jgi:hypothetical protein